MLTSEEYIKQQQVLESSPYSRYKRALWKLEEDFERNKRLLNKELEKQQNLCGHPKTYYHTGPDGWCECLICGKAL
jgi:hypothetical protein